MRIEWHPAALAEFEAAFLDSQSFGQSTVDAFAGMVDQVVQRLADNPDLARVGRSEGTREVVLRRFPYILVYRRQEDHLLIVALRHTARRWPASFPND